MCLCFLRPLLFEDVTENIKNIKSGSPGEFTGLAGSPIGHQMGHQVKKHSKKRRKISEDGDESEKESILARTIADALVDNLCYDE
jgi:hypothetical protein